MTRAEAVRAYIRSLVVGIDFDFEAMATFSEASKQDQDARLSSYLTGEKTKSVAHDAALDAIKAAEAAKRADINATISTLTQP